MPTKRKTAADLLKRATRLIPEDLADVDGPCYEYLSAISEVEEQHDSITAAIKADDDEWRDDARHELVAAHRRANRQLPKCRLQLETAAARLVKAAAGLPGLPEDLARE